MTGRAQGRARRRPRGGASHQPTAVRPGQQAQPAPKMAPTQPAQSACNDQASHAGGAPGDQAADLSGQNAAMSRANGIASALQRCLDQVSKDIRTREDNFDKRGTSGKKVTLLSNYFKLNQRLDKQLYQYHVTFSPEVESKKLRMELVRDHQDMLGPTRKFDGMILFLGKRLQNDKTEVLSTHHSDNTQIRITFQLTNELPPDSPVCIQFYNIIFKQQLEKIGMTQVRRRYYDLKKGVRIDKHKLEVWPGLITAIHQYEKEVMLCVKICHKILRTDTVLDIMYEMYNQHSGGFHDNVTKKFVGEIVLTTYNNKTYRVDDIDWENHPTYRFKRKDAKIDLVTYYKEQYNITIEDLKQPLLVSLPNARDQNRKQNDPIFLIPELCHLTGLSDEVRKDFTVRKDLAVHTSLDPSQQSQKLKSFMQTLTKNEDVQTQLAGWTMPFDNQLLQIQGRTLNAERITQKKIPDGRIESYEIQQASAHWGRQASREYMFISSVKLKYHQWIVLSTRQDARLASEFIRTLKQIGTPLGMVVEDPVLLVLEDHRSSTYDRILQQNIQQGTSLVVCIVPSRRKDRYDVIKKRCCLLSPVHSQVIVAHTLTKNKSVVTNLAFQLNCKLGGEIWTVEIPIGGLMVVGVDCYHDSARKGRSVSAFVASTNRNLTKYYSRCNMQMSHQEIINGLKVNMKNALTKYHAINGVLPQRIIIYRDGVGDGQLAAVVEQEIPQIVDSFQTVAEAYSPKMAVVVVTKRHNSQFFLHTPQNIQNPLPGTIVDSDVTKPGWYDFFLVSQSVRQGTVNPTHYNVVHDSLGFSPDQMQRITYKLTHLYYNWPGTIRVPAPCQYAHKMAFLVGQSLHEVVENGLCDTLFYL